MVVAFALSVLAGLAIAAWLARLDARALTAPAGSSSRPRQYRLSNAVAVGLACATLAELKVPSPVRPVPPIEKAYRVLATLPVGPVLDIPVYSAPFASERTHYLLGSTAHWMPLVTGYSSHTPKEFYENAGVLAEFPSRESFRLLARDDVRYAVLHMHALSPEGRADLQRRLQAFAGYLVRRYMDAEVWVYEIVGFPGGSDSVDAG
jgi:hypothetical protein